MQPGLFNFNIEILLGNCCISRIASIAAPGALLAKSRRPTQSSHPTVTRGDGPVPD